MAIDTKTKDKIIELRLGGYGIKSIAKKVGVSPTTVTRCIAKHGLPTKLEQIKIYSRQCETCGMGIQVRNDIERFCSDACRQRARKIRFNGRKKCTRCSSSIQGLQNTNYCSVECKNKFILSKKTIKLSRFCCISCGKTRLVRRKRKYCSRMCVYNSIKGRENEWYKNNADRLSEERKKKYSLKVKHNHKCAECGKHFTSTSSVRRFCNSGCGDKFHYRLKEVRRREKIVSNGKVDWSISIERLTKRDGRTCYLCNSLMDYNVDYNDPAYPNIEHIKPVSKGGTHTWDNVYPLF